MRVGYKITDASRIKHDLFTISCHRQIYQNYDFKEAEKKLGTFLEKKRTLKVKKIQNDSWSPSPIVFTEKKIRKIPPNFDPKMILKSEFCNL